MNHLYINQDKVAVTHKSLNSSCSFINNVANGMKKMVEDMLPESAENQYGQLCLLIHGLNGIIEASCDLYPDVTHEKKAGAA